MKITYKCLSNFAIIYGLLIIIIHAVNIELIRNDNMPPYNITSSQGCVIHDKYNDIRNLSGAIIGITIVSMLFLMCVQNPTEDYNFSYTNIISNGNDGMIPVVLAVTFYVLSFHLTNMQYHIESYGSRHIRNFKVTGCNDTLINFIYVGILFNALPMLLFGAVVGCIIAGGILWGIGYVIWTWIGSWCDIEWICRKNNKPPPTDQIHSNSISVEVNDKLQRSVSHASLPPAYTTIIIMDNSPPAYTTPSNSHTIANTVAEVIV